MKDLERFLTDLPKPAVEVPAFRDELRRELLSIEAVPASSGWRWTALGAGTLAAACLLLVVVFVARPGIPARLHATLGGTVPTELPLPPTLAEDRAFVDNWVARQAGPVEIRSMGAERTVTVREFEFTDGKRMLVFSEVAKPVDQPAIMRASSPAPVY